jgi:hypothetical protein
MSKLYCKISESARRTVPTARAHGRATVEVANWKFRISVTMLSNGGGGADTVSIVITNLETGYSEQMVNETAGEIWRQQINAPAT